LSGWNIEKERRGWVSSGMKRREEMRKKELERLKSS
jgi:hypothetical protein